MSIIENVKDIAKLAQQIQNADLYDRIVALQSEILEQLEERHRLLDENRQLKERLALRKNLQFKQNVYWLRDGDKTDGPYCPRCNDADDVLQHMVIVGKNQLFGCPNCRFVLRGDGSPPTPTERTRFLVSFGTPKKG